VIGLAIEVLEKERVRVEPNQIRVGTVSVQPQQIRPYPVGFYPLQTGFDWNQMLQMMMTMMQMVLMIVFMMLPIKMLPTILESIKTE